MPTHVQTVLLVSSIFQLIVRIAPKIVSTVLTPILVNFAEKDLLPLLLAIAEDALFNALLATLTILLNALLVEMVFGLTDQLVLNVLICV